MGLPRRGSRRITVGGRVYRWAVSPDDGYLVLVAELATDSGQRLEAFFRYSDLHESDGAGGLRVVGQRRSVSPGVVRAVIDAALGGGWQPERRGLPPLRVPDADRLAPVEDACAAERGAAADPRRHHDVDS